MTQAHRLFRLAIVFMALLASLGSSMAATFAVTRATWGDGGRLRVEGTGMAGATVTIRNAYSGAAIGTAGVNSRAQWSRVISRPSPVPCRVRAEQSGGIGAESDVANRPADCGPVAPGLSVNDVNVTEGGSASFTVTLSPAATQTAAVVVSTANATAVAPGDYSARTGVTLTFPPGTTAQTFTVATVDDFSPETAETFKVNLSAAINATFADPQGVATIADNDRPATRPNVSINSTSRNRLTLPATAVPQLARTTTSGYQILAVNDLGMHCGDLDTRISSILPPFNVLHAQVVQMGGTGVNRPRKLGEGEVIVRYSAAANPNDPVLANAASVLDPGFNGVYKTGFWESARTAYDPFYPTGVLSLFYPSADILDLGLPVPDLERLYLGDGLLAANQQEMPGSMLAYDATSGNAAMPFSRYIGTQPFFTAFPFGYTAPVYWFEAAGIPITSFDDFGRENAYPLMRVQATAAPGNSLGLPGGTVLSSLDTVVPVSGEANCAACHAATGDGGNGSAIARLGGNVALSIDDPQSATLPNPVSVEWAADKNMLKLHDVKHATHLIAGTTEDFPLASDAEFRPVVCQTCHYSPALDLAHAGPNDVNGRQQSSHRSMSAVMHAGHADVVGGNGQRLFPAMPGPLGRDPARAQQVLEASCYMCHPGKRTQCLRGAMGQAGAVCQDCHGDMAQVGNDFSRSGGFVLAADYYTNPATPRVPWANQPGCGSCHTGDALSNLTAEAGAVKAPDNLRLLQAWFVGDPRATPIVPDNKRFAENIVAGTENAAAAGNPKLFRVSSGHGGLTCAACHGATHAEWAASPLNPNANDNLTPTQLQGHPGTLIECATCHTAYTGTNLNGPHGMHPVGDGKWIGGHRNLAQTTAQKNACRACHGLTGQGTPLSKVPVARVVGNRTFAKGELVTCTKCHGNKL